MDEDHLGAVFEDQVSDSTVGQCDAHQVLTLQSQNLHKSKDPSLTWSDNKAMAAKRVSNTGVTESAKMIVPSIQCLFRQLFGALVRFRCNSTNGPDELAWRGVCER